MSKAEERANEAYPFKEGDIVYDEERVEEAQGYYIEGYEQAEQDLIEKAKQWFTDNIPSEKVQLWWCEFEQFITEN